MRPLHALAAGVCGSLLAALAAGQTPFLFPEIPVNTYTSLVQSHPSVSIAPSGGFVVVWQGQDADNIGVKGRRFDALGNPLADEFQVNTSTTGGQYAARVATDSAGNFVVVWSSFVSPDFHEILGQRFDSSGAAAGGEFQINTYTTGTQYAPSVAMNASGKFVVIWTSVGQDGDDDGVFGQRFDTDGTPLGGEFQVNTTTTGVQYAASIGMDTTGGFFVVWSGGPHGGSNFDVFGRKYGPAGNALGPEFQVNGVTGVDAREPAVSVDNDGDTVVVWDQPDGDGRGVYGQRFDESGLPEALPFRVNSSAAGYQYRASVAFDQSHDFIVAWQSQGQDDPGDAAGGGVFARRFGDPNVPVGAEFQVNAYTTDSQQRPSISMNASGNFVLAWDSEFQDGSIVGVFARRGEFHAAQSMAVDAHSTGATSSNLNGVLEAGETVRVEPSWQNTLASSQTFSGLAQDLTGPPGPAYTLVDDSAEYGNLASQAVADCGTATDDCYVMAISGARPAPHWDATFSETLAGLGTKDWSLHVGESFPDVATTHPFYGFIENLFHNGVTGGCGGGGYCPSSSVTRGQMAVFLLKSEHGATFAPPVCSGVFPDVPCPSQFADWIEQLAAEGITGGCGGGNYCPDNPVTRQQMAVFLLKARFGSTYVPPACAGIFGDVPCPSQFADWIEDLSAQGITGGCGSGNYCPTNPNTRGQMAVFLVKTFGLLLYGS